MDLPFPHAPSPHSSGGRKPRPRVPEDKRKRAARACDECRKKKEKCDGRPACGRCLRYRVQCHYKEATNVKIPRSVRNNHVPGQVTRQNSDDISLSDSERMQCMERILAHYHQLGRSLTNSELRDWGSSLPEVPTAASSRERSYDEFTARSSKSPLCTARPVLEDAGKEIGYYEDLSLNEFTRKIKSAITRKLPSSTSEDTERVATTSHPEDSDLKLNALHGAISCIPPRPIGQFLLDVFFRYLQTSIYYVEETWAYEFLDSFYMQPLRITSSDIPGVCTILMVMACGTQFAHLESFQLAERMAKDSSRRQDSHFSEDGIGKKFHQAAQTLVPFVVAMPSIYSVQACLMMATYNFSLDAAGTSYIYLSLALSLAVQQGMHRWRNDSDGSNSHSSGIAAEVRKRSWWTVYILHLQASIRYGRPSYLTGFQVSIEKPIDVLELRPLKEASNNFSNQIGLIELTLTTQKIADEIASLRRTKNLRHFSNLLSIRQNLIKWWEGFLPGAVPLVTDMNNTNNPRRLRNNIHLRLYYCNTLMSLGRPFAFSTETSPIGPAGARQLHERETLLKDSIDGALEVINLCEVLRDQIGLARASYVTEFTSCRAAMLVLLAESLSNKQNPKIREALSRGLDIMKIMAIGNSLASSELGLIEVLERAVIQLDYSKMPDDGGSALDSRVQDKSNYDSFKIWTQFWQGSSSKFISSSSSTLGAANVASLDQNAPFENYLEATTTPSFHPLDQSQTSNTLQPEYLTFGNSISPELSQFDVIPVYNTIPGSAYEQGNAIDAQDFDGGIHEYNNLLY